MAYLLVLNYDILDPAKFSEYTKRAPGTIPPEMKVLAFDQKPYDLEGKSAQNLTIAEFPSQELALKWYESEGYRAARRFRLEATAGWLRGVPKLG